VAVIPGAWSGRIPEGHLRAPSDFEPVLVVYPPDRRGEQHEAGAVGPALGEGQACAFRDVVAATMQQVRVVATGIKNWLYRCALAHKTYGSEVLALVPVASNTGHWKKYVFGKARSICFLYDTRLKFLVNGENGGKGAPMSCAMVYWGKDHVKFSHIFRKFGAVLSLKEVATPADSDHAVSQMELVSEI
jgi:hypothetical protein